MKSLERIFGGLNMTWIKVIIFAIITGAYTALINQVPFLKDTSFQDIAIQFECWILFGILIIMNSKSNIDSALKCFVFFLISQPLVYLVEVPFLGWSVLGYYRNWILWTILTLTMGFIGYYMKKDKWWGLLILTPMLAFLGTHYSGYLGSTFFAFPHHLLSCIFCFATIIIYPIAIFRDKKIKIAGAIISSIIVIVMTILTLLNLPLYNTTILLSGGESGIVFDDTYKVYLEDERMGNVYIKYDGGLEDYMIDASFKKTGKTNLVVESPSGEKEVYEVNVISQSYFEVEKKN